MPPMKKGILAKKVWETNGRKGTVPAKPCNRNILAPLSGIKAPRLCGHPTHNQAFS